MSADATGYTYRCSPFKGATLACHLAIADSVNDQHGNEFFMAVAKLARKARVTRKSAQVALRQLELAGFLELLEHPDGEVRRYRFCFPQVDVVYESRGRRDYAPPAKLTAWRGRNHNAQTQVVTQPKARGASHFMPGAGWIDDIEREDDTA